MEKQSKGIRIEIVIIIILVLIIVIGGIFLLDIDLTNDQIIKIFEIGAGTVATVVVLWIKGSFDKRKIVKKNEEQHLVLFDEIANTNSNVDTLNNKVGSLEKSSLSMDEHVKHKNFIKSINAKIERSILEIMKREINISGEMRIILIDAGVRIYSVLHTALEGGFDDFNMDYIETKLIGQAKNLRSNINYKNLNVTPAKFNSKLKNEVIYPLISEYIKELNSLIMLENGKRRKQLEISTIRFVESLAQHTIRISKETKVKKKD